MQKSHAPNNQGQFTLRCTYGPGDWDRFVAEKARWLGKPSSRDKSSWCSARGSVGLRSVHGLGGVPLNLHSAEETLAPLSYQGAMAGNPNPPHLPPQLEIVDEHALDPHVLPHPCVHSREPVGPEPGVWARYVLIQEWHQFIITFYEDRTLRSQCSSGIDSPRHGWWDVRNHREHDYPGLIEMHWHYEGRQPLAKHIYVSMEKLDITRRTGALSMVSRGTFGVLVPFPTPPIPMHDAPRP